MATVGRSKNNKNTINTRKVTYAAQHLMAVLLQELLSIKEPYHVIASHIQNTSLWKRLDQKEKTRISKVAKKESYAHFDIQLSYKVLRSLNIVPPPTRGWGQNPESTENSVGDDIERIKSYRNKFAHKGKCEITDSGLTEWFSKFKVVAKRMEEYLDKRNGTFTETFSKLETGSIDDNRDAYLNTIRLAKEEVDQLRLDNDNSNINDAMVVQIEEWEKIDEKFVSTDLCEKVITKIKEYNVITVYGKSGIGKSATIHHLALVLRKQNQYEIIPCHSPKDMVSKFRKNKRQAFVFDDVCGRYSAIQDEINSWLRYEHLLKRITRDEKVKVIVSCRLQVFKEEQFQRICFLKECSIEFTDNLITPEQKRSISKKYLGPNLIPNIENIINKCDFFPLMCSLYSNHTEKDIVDFFENPFDIYMSEFDSIKQDPNKVKYFTVILIVLCNGELHFPTEEYRDTSAGHYEIYLQDLFKYCGISRKTPETDIIMHLDSLVGTFLKTNYYRNNVGKNMVIYQPLHAKLFDYMCHHCGLHFQNVIMKYANSSLLSQQTRLESIAETEEAPITIRSENEEEFFCRITEDMLNNNSEEIHVFRSPQMKCFEYRQKFIVFLTRNESILKSSFKDKKIGKKVLVGILTSNYPDLIEFAINIAGSLISVLDLAYCTEQNFVSRLKKMFRNIKTASITIDKYSYTPLVCASYHGHNEIVKLLLSEGASVNCNASHRQLTPLLAAIAGNNSNIVDMILENEKLGVNIVNNRKFSPLMMACCFGNFSAVRSLVDRGARLDDIDKCGQTALMFASRNGFSDIVQFLLECGADIALRSRKQWTSLMFACKGGHKNIVDYLIEKGLSVNEVDVHGKTPLHIAAKQQFLDLCVFLSLKGAKIDLIDDDAVFAITKVTDTEDNSATVAKTRSDVKIVNHEFIDLPLVEEIELDQEDMHL